MSYAEFPSKAYYQKLAYEGKLEKYYTHYKRNMTFEMARKSLASVFIYFDQLEYTQISEQAATSGVVLVSNMGGALGLFLGLSVLGLLEIVYLLAGLVSLPFRAAYRRRNNQKQQNSLNF